MSAQKCVTKADIIYIMPRTIEGRGLVRLALSNYRRIQTD